jgi:large subunit ribosomal protein L10
MENPRPEKVAKVTEVRERLSNADAAILTEYRGLSVKDMATLRASLRESGGDYKVYKNTLVRFAVRDLELNDLEESLTGPTAIAFVDGDPSAVAKALKEFSKSNPNLVVKGGVLGTKPLSAADAAALAELPSREVALSQLAGLLAQPMQQFASLLQTLPRNLAYGLQGLIDKGGAAGSSPAAGSKAEETPAASDAEAESTDTAADAATESE